MDHHRSDAGRSRAARLGLGLARTALAALFVGAAVLVSSAPAAEAAQNSNNQAPQPGDPLPQPCLTLCFSSFQFGHGSSPGGRYTFTWVYETNLVTKTDVQVSRSSQLDANGNLTNLVAHKKDTLGHTYHHDSLGFDTGGTHYWLVKATANGMTITKTGSVQTPYVVNPNLVPLPKP